MGVTFVEGEVTGPVVLNLRTVNVRTTGFHGHLAIGI
jgi:hypothetical protein